MVIFLRLINHPFHCVGILIALAIVLSGCGEPETPAPTAPEVTVSRVESGDTPVTFEFVGNTVSPQQVEVRARVDGFLNERPYARADAYLNQQSGPLTDVAQLDPMWVDSSISDDEMLKLREQLKTGRLRFPENDAFTTDIILADGSIYPKTGKIFFRDANYSSQTGTFLIRAAFENPDDTLRSGQFVRVQVKGATRPDAILAPQTAVLQGAGGFFVWVVDKDGKAQTYAGADAQTVAQNVDAPIEQQVNGADHMIYMQSTSSSTGNYTLYVYFDQGTAPRLAQVDVQNRVQFWFEQDRGQGGREAGR